MKSAKQLWIALGLVMGISFAVLGYYGYEIYQKAPPVPDQVVTDKGEVLFTGQDIKDGQNVWQSMGGQEVGTVWGHGAYVAPDWTADWLHREAQFFLNSWSQREFNSSFDDLNSEQKAQLEKRLQNELRENRYDPETRILTVSSLRAEAIEHLSNYYTGLFTDAEELDELRSQYAIPKNAIRDQERMQKMNTFFFWAAWSCVTERPGSDITYTHNWPPDAQVGNKPTGDLLIWTGFSIILLLIGIGILVFYHARQGGEEELETPVEDPLIRQDITPSMKAVQKYME